ncbi:hypothetical protein D3C73_1055090 [compost metagenome]
MQIRNITGGSTSGIDNHHLQQWISLSCLHQPLVQHWMRPRGIRSHQHHQIATLDIFIAAGHHVGTQRPLIAGHRRRHAKPRVGIDIGRTDKTFHQLVGRVVIFRQ